MQKLASLLVCWLALRANAQTDIFDAIYSYDTSSVKEYIQTGGNLNVTQHRNISLSTGKRKKVGREISVYDGALLYIRLGNESKDPDLIISAYRNFELLIEQFQTIENKKERLDNMLGVAVSTGDVSLVRWVLENGADINKPCDVCYGRTPTLIAVAYNSNLEMIKFLLSQKPDLSLRDYDGRGYLHYAARNSNIILLEHLLSQNIEPINTKDYNGMTPVFDAVIGNSIETYNFFLKQGAETELFTDKKQNLLFHAAQTDNLNLFRQVYFTSGVEISVKLVYKLTNNPWIVQFLKAEHLKREIEN